MKKNASRPTKIKGKRKHGFRKRMTTAAGREIINQRRKKGRTRVSV